MIQFILRMLAFVIAVVPHEVSHGVVANHFGDDTAKRAGRLTLNPLVHIDPIGTVLLPIILALSGVPPIGYAKPVPVNISRLRKPRNESVLVSLAGPTTNFVLSFIGWIVLVIFKNQLLDPTLYPKSNLGYFILFFGIVNFWLGIFNLIPIPPFDGSALIERLVPRAHLPRYFELRSRFLPIALIVMLIILNTSLGKNIQSDLINWWVTSLA